jgi:hypothetical protein
MVGKYSTYGTSMKAAALQLVKKVANGLITDTIDSFRATKSGNVYSSLPNRSSAPGETPAFQSGELARSITMTSMPTPLGAEAEVRVTAEYAKYLVANKRPILSANSDKYRSILRNGVLVLSNKLQGGL